MDLKLTKQHKKVQIKFLIAYFLFLFIFWTISRLIILPSLEKTFVETSLVYALSEAFLKIIVWLLPVFFILKLEKFNPISFLKLNLNIKSGTLYGLGIGILLLIINVIKSKNRINFHFSYSEIINTFILVGLIEEIAFRGFIFQKLKLFTNFWGANIITSVLFMIIHIPILLYAGTLIPFTFIQIGILSLIFGYFFEESNSLLCPIIIHSLWDLSTILTLIAK